MSTKNFPVGQSGRRVGLTTLPLSMSRMSENVGISRNPKGLHGLYKDNFTLILPYLYLSIFILLLPPPWLYSPILGLGRLHETFRFISVTRSRTVGRTPWTGDQLVAWPLLTAPGDYDDDGEVGGMNGFGRGNRSTRRKPAPTPLRPPHIPLARPGREPGPPRWETSD
jgi:hypothetical protein